MLVLVHSVLVGHVSSTTATRVLPPLSLAVAVALAVAVVVAVVVAFALTLTNRFRPFPRLEETIVDRLLVAGRARPVDDFSTVASWVSSFSLCCVDGGNVSSTARVTAVTTASAALLLV